MDRNASHAEPADQFSPPSSSKTAARPTAIEMLDRLALVLGIPADTFSRSDRAKGAEARILNENAEALGIFAGITDPEAREKALAYLRWIADQNALR